MLKGLIIPSEVSYLVNEVSRLPQLIKLSPISKEDDEFIKSVFTKGSIETVE